MMKYTFDQNVPCKIYDQTLIAFTYYKPFTFLRFPKTWTGWHKFKKEEEEEEKKKIGESNRLKKKCSKGKLG